MTKGYSFQKHHFPEFIASNRIDNNTDHLHHFTRDIQFEDIEKNIFSPQRKNVGTEEWEEKLKQAKREAYELGFNQGQDEGIKKNRKDLEPLLRKFEIVLADIENTKKRIYTEAEKEAVDLSIAIAKKIVGNEILTNKSVITHIVKEALKRVEGHDQIKILVNPSEIDILNIARNELNDIVQCMDKVEIAADDAVAPGGCIIHTNIGDIDARIEKQLKIVEDAFKQENS